MAMKDAENKILLCRSPWWLFFWTDPMRRSSRWPMIKSIVEENFVQGSTKIKWKERERQSPLHLSDVDQPVDVLRIEEISLNPLSSSSSSMIFAIGKIEPKDDRKFFFTGNIPLCLIRSTNDLIWGREGKIFHGFGRKFLSFSAQEFVEGVASAMERKGSSMKMNSPKWNCLENCLEDELFSIKFHIGDLEDLRNENGREKKDPSSHLTNNSFFFEFLDEKWSVESDRWSIELRSMEKCHQWRFFPLRGRVVFFVGILSSSSQIRPIGRRNSSRKSFLKDIFIANEENLRRYSKDSISRYCPGKIVNQSEEEEENFSSEKIVPFNLLLSKWQWRRNVSSSMDSTLLFKWKQSQSDNGGDMKRCVSRKNEVGRRREEEILSSNWQIERKENWFDEELSSMRKWKNWMKTSNARLWTRLALSRRNDSLKP